MNNLQANVRLVDLRSTRRRMLLTLKRMRQEALDLAEKVPSYRRLEFETEVVVIDSAITALDHEGAPLGLSESDKEMVRAGIPKLKRLLRNAS